MLELRTQHPILSATTGVDRNFRGDLLEVKEMQSRFVLLGMFLEQSVPTEPWLIATIVSQHMKIQEDEEIWIDQAVNSQLVSWKQKPPRKNRIVCTREEGFPLEVKLAED